MSGSYRDIKAWQKAIELVVEVYSATRSFPRQEVYGLASQLRRAAVSVASNIAEGKGRCTDKEFLLFLHHARGRLGYLTQADEQGMGTHAGEIARMLNGLIKAIKSADGERAA